MKDKERKVYQMPSVRSFDPIAAIPALAAPLAILSFNSVAAFVGGAAVGVGAATVASKALGSVEMNHKLRTLVQVEAK